MARPSFRLPIVLALLAAVPALAGCAEDGGAAPADGGDVGDITDPRDLLNGTAPGSHIHDYWGGRDRVTVLEASDGPNGATCEGCTDGMTFTSERPEEGAIVPQGTAWVNGTFTLQSDGQDQYEAIELWVKTAQDAEPWRWGPIRSGEPFAIASSQERNDPPHYVLSLWVFELRVVGGSDLHIGGTYGWHVEAVRGLPLVPYPPHPDRWDGATELHLLADAGGSELTYQMEDPAGGTSITCNGGCPGRHILPSGAVIPFDTGRVEVTLTFEDGVPAGLGLWFHGSDTWEETKAEGTRDAMDPLGPVVYSIPVEGSMADSPYAPQSLWEFQVWLDQPQPSLQAWAGQYTIEVRAFRS